MLSDCVRAGTRRLRQQRCPFRRLAARTLAMEREERWQQVELRAASAEAHDAGRRGNRDGAVYSSSAQFNSNAHAMTARFHDGTFCRGTVAPCSTPRSQPCSYPFFQRFPFTHASLPLDPHPQPRVTLAYPCSLSPSSSAIFAPPSLPPLALSLPRMRSPPHLLIRPFSVSRVPPHSTHLGRPYRRCSSRPVNRRAVDAVRVTRASRAAVPHPRRPSKCAAETPQST